VKNKLLALLVLATGFAVSTPELIAGEKATTADLPEALRALAPDHSRILRQDEAEAIRGEAIGPIFLAQAIGVTNPFTGVTHTFVGIGYATPGFVTYIYGRIVGPPIEFNVTRGAGGSLNVSIR